MYFSRASRFLFVAFAFTVFLFAAGCAVPLGSGFHIEKQRVRLTYSAQTPDRVHVRADYRLKNTGNADLTAITVDLPTVQASGRFNLRVTMDGWELAVPGIDDSRRSQFTIPLGSPWPKKSKRTLLIEYDLDVNGRTPGSPRDLSLTVAWFPVLVKPGRLFAQGTRWAEKTDVSIRVPQGFRVLAGGEPHTGETQLRFRLRGEDLSTFVVFGPYSEQVVRTADGTVVFWTLRPLSADQAQKGGAHIAATANAYKNLFGPATKKEHPTYLVEESEWLDSAPPAVSFYSFPKILILNQQAFALRVNSDPFLRLADVWLARTWMDGTVAPASSRETKLQEACIEYGQFVARSEPGRADRIAALLSQYERTTRQIPERPISEHWPVSEIDAQHRLQEDKSLLFLFALEDRIAKESLHHALRHLVQALRGKTWNVNDLRSALELESGQNLAEFFRVWLYQPGIPEDFRRRYEPPR